MSSNPVPLTVCHIASGDRWAGAEVQVASLLRALRNIGGIDLCAIILNEGRLAEELRRSCREVRVLPEQRLSFWQICAEARRFVQGRGVGILHSHRYKENLLATYLAWRCAIPVIVRTQHGLPEPFGTFKHQLMQFLDRMTAQFTTDCVIGVSWEMQEYLTHRVGAKKVAIIHNGLDVAGVVSKKSAREAKRSLGIDEGCFVIGSAGRLEPVKRLDIFLSAAHEISMQLPSARFLIAGSGSDDARLRQIAQTLEMGDRVVFLGERVDIYDVLRAMDVFLMCSDHEGLPMILLETLCLGVPVVARRVGGISEVIQHGLSGILVDSTDPAQLAHACMSLLDNEGQRRQLACAGIEVVKEKFAADKTAAEMTHLYQQLWEAR